MIKVFEDKKAAADFRQRVESAAQRSNELLNIWHEFQPFHRCTDVETFEKIAAAPGIMFDRVLLDNVKMSATGGLKPSPDMIAKLYDLNRTDFYNLCEGRPVKLETCAPCARAKVKPGKTAISLSDFRKYAPYLIFDDGEFIIDTDAVAEHLKTYDIYATSPAQLATVKHFDDLAQLLNKHCAEYQINNNDKERIATALSLQLSQGIAGDFLINSEHVKNLIQSIK